MESAGKSSEEQNVDRLSELPDGVICHILSFLGTERSVQTSILAKRWRTLWAHVPLLYFDCWKYRYSLSKTKRFPGMVCAILLRHKAQTLKIFSLIHQEVDDPYVVDGPNGCFEVETCIAVVVERNIQVLSLDLRVELPRCLLTCKTLVDLRLNDGVSITSSGPISLPSLKKLHFFCSKYGVDLAPLLSGCPVLEDLLIHGYPRSSCNISSPTLKMLNMVYFMGIENHPRYLVNIIAPALTFLNVNDCSNKFISISPPASLVEAHISLTNSFESDDLYPGRVLKFLDSFCNVKCLRISGQFAEFPDIQVSGPYVRFGNLTQLELNADWCLITRFLQSADQLEVLILYEIHKKSESWTEPILESCACLLHSLRTVTIYRFECTEQDCNMVSFILRNAQVLKRMEIRCQPIDWNKKSDALQRISSVRRGSTECEIVFR